MRTYPDGWKVGRGRSLCPNNRAHEYDDHVLLNPQGDVVASVWVSMGSEGSWGYRKWCRYSPLGRVRIRHHVASIVCLLAAALVFLPGQPVWVPAVQIAASANVMWWGWKNRRVTREARDGRNRTAETDHPDTEASGTPAATGTADTAAASEGASEDVVTLDTVDEDMPILAHRYVKLVPTDTGLAFGSVATEGTFSVDADATCHAWDLHLPPSYYRAARLPVPHIDHHDAPGVDCSCGFYAVPADQLPRYGGYNSGVSLLVELSGTVIEHEYGYRAEHQRVVQVTAPPCPGCGGPAVKAWRNLTSDPGLVWDCGNHEMLPIATNTPIVAMTLDQISNMLGVPVVSR